MSKLQTQYYVRLFRLYISLSCQHLASKTHLLPVPLFTPPPHFILQTAAALTLLSSSSLVEDLDGPADVQVEQSNGSSPLPLTFLLQGSQEVLHIDFRTPADPATETQGEAALLTVEPWHICLTIRATPAPAALCCA